MPAAHAPHEHAAVLPEDIMPEMYDDVDPAAIQDQYFGAPVGARAEEEDQIAGLISEDPLGALLYSHESYPDLVDAFFDLQMVGQVKEEVQRLKELKKEGIQRVVNDRERALVRGRVKPEAVQELNVFMVRYIQVIRNLIEEFGQVQQSLLDPVRLFESEVTKIIGLGASLSLEDPAEPAAAPNKKPQKRQSDPEAPNSKETAPISTKKGRSSAEEGAGAGAGAGARGDAVLSSVDATACFAPDEAMVKILQERYQIGIANVQKKFKEKAPKPKLPEKATAVLMKWWNANYCWPYPDDETKAQLAEKCGCTATQITNWCINRRKRTWIGHFPERKAPETKDKSLTFLLKAGLVDKNGKRTGSAE